MLVICREALWRGNGGVGLVRQRWPRLLLHAQFVLDDVLWRETAFAKLLELEDGDNWRYWTILRITLDQQISSSSVNPPVNDKHK